MNYVLKGHNWSDDIVSTVMMFYPNDKYVQLDSSEGLTLVSELTDGKAAAAFYEDGKEVYRHIIPVDSNSEKSVRYGIRMSAYHCLMHVKPVKMAWGALTGVRPAKIVWSMWDEGMSDDEVCASLKNDYCVSEEKIALALSVAKNERRIVQNGSPDKVGLYIGIPFCPTRCLYCSFTSYPLRQYSDRVDKYLDALEREMDYVSGIIADKTIESLYIGGGTPTSLNEVQLDRLLAMVQRYFKTPLEYTVEAGRPDTITRQKLKSLKRFNVGRISINPQTLNDKTLEIIGREHNTDMFYKAFELAREEGHSHINTDIILGLPSEGEAEVKNTMEGLARLSPESITVHTLAVKRASRLKETLEKYNMTQLEDMEKMLSVAANGTKAMGMHPYYMYRQKNMVGNFENVGYCKPNCECIYNVQIMEEKQSIWALGAGGSTKLVDNKTDRIERVFNVKSVDDYINRIDEMLERKESILKLFK